MFDWAIAFLVIGGALMADVRFPIEEPLDVGAGAGHDRHDPGPVARHHRIPMNTKSNADSSSTVASSPAMIGMVNRNQVPETQLVDAQ